MKKMCACVYNSDGWKNGNTVAIPFKNKNFLNQSPTNHLIEYQYIKHF